MKKIPSILFLFITIGVSAQDYHLSHYDVAGMYLNPAMTGLYAPDKPDFRVYFDHRSQWRALGVKPYSTSYLGYDRAQKIGSRNFGLGGYLVNNSAGINNLNTLGVMISGAYDIINSTSKSVSSVKPVKHLLSVGLQLGIFYRTTNANNLSYDVQYSPGNGSFDQSIPNNESYNRLSMVRFDAAYGLYYKLVEKGRKYRPFAGISMFHLTRPRESLTGGPGKLPIRYAAHGGCEITINDKSELRPRILFMSQSRAMDLVPGLQYYHRLKDNPLRLMAGFDWRVRDAAIISIGANNDAYAVRLSYDFTVSYLKNYIGSRGAFELSLIYTGDHLRAATKAVLQEQQ
jgi:type IX secretion system PorP/SprF family membrane protein